MTRSEHRSGWRGPLVLALVGTLASCTDGPSAITRPADAVPLPPGAEILGGRASIEAAAATLDSLEKEGRLDEIDPEARKLIREASRHVTRTIAPAYTTGDGSSITGPYDINGETFYEEGGEYYPPAGRPAVILQQKTTGVLKPGYAEVTAVFQYEGHNATQKTTWTISDLRTGVVLRERPLTTFGSKVDHFFGWIRFFSGTEKIYNLPKCNTTLTAESYHEAWWNGWWDFADEGSAGTNLILGIKIVREKQGTVNTTSAISPAMSLRCQTYITEDCDEEDDTTDDEDGTDGLDRSVGSAESDALRSLTPTGTARYACDGGGGFGDENGCTVCQQWFTMYRDKIIAEWWECHEASADECEELMR